MSATHGKHEEKEKEEGERNKEAEKAVSSAIVNILELLHFFLLY